MKTTHPFVGTLLVVAPDHLAVALLLAEAVRLVIRIDLHGFDGRLLLLALGVLVRGEHLALWSPTSASR
jgi:hypothetical protein